jgi:hypothetical protein
VRCSSRGFHLLPSIFSCNAALLYNLELLCSRWQNKIYSQPGFQGIPLCHDVLSVLYNGSQHGQFDGVCSRRVLYHERGIEAAGGGDGGDVTALNGCFALLWSLPKLMEVGVAALL